MRLILASASPARRTLLAAAGIDAEVVVSGVDESTVEEERAEDLCLRLAELKALAVAGETRDALVLGCDSVLAFGGEVLGKPASAAEATDRWRSMRGKSGVLHTGHHLIDTGTGRSAGAVSSTTVHWADVSDEEIAAYVATGEPLRVAGAFTIDGIGAPFVRAIEGDHGTVVGLSMPLLRTLLADLGHPITGFWKGG